MTSPNRNSEES